MIKRITLYCLLMFLSFTGFSQVGLNISNLNCPNTSNGGASVANPSMYTDWFWYDSNMTLLFNGGSMIEFPAGNYAIVAVDTNSISDTTYFSITEPSPIVITTTTTDETGLGTCDGFIYSTVSGGMSGYTYNWSNSSNTPNISGLCAGTYTLTVVDISGCVSTTNASIMPGADPCQGFYANTNVYNETAQSACNGSIDVYTSGGTAPFTYTWPDSLLNGSYISSLCPGTYSVTVTDANNCTYNTVGTVIAYDPCSSFSAYAYGYDETAPSACDGSIMVNTYGTMPYTFTWSDSLLNGFNPIGLCPGTYSVTVSDSNNCSTTATATVNVFNPCNGFYGNTNATPETAPSACDGSISITLNGTAPYTFIWSDSLLNGQNPANVCPGYYTVTIFDANSCNTSVSVMVQAYSPCNAFTVSSSATDETSASACDGTITVSASSSGPWSYQWSDSLLSGANVSGLCPGYYYVTVYDTNGCSANTSASIYQYNPCGNFTVYSNPTHETAVDACDGAIEVFANGGTAPYNYQWSDSLLNGASVAGLCPGYYMVTVTDNNGCTNNTSAMINQFPDSNNCTLTATVSITLNPDSGMCNGQAYAVVTGGTAPFVYDWQNGETSDFAVNLCEGENTLVVTDANNCVVYPSYFLTVGNPCLGFSAYTNVSSETSNGACDGSITVNVNGTAPFNFMWSDSLLSGGSVSGLCSGTYNVFVSDANNCTTTLSSTITFIPDSNCNVVISVSSVDESTLGACDGSAYAVVSGGTAPYTYDWNGIATTQSIVALCPGTYNVLVIDNLGCQASTSVVIMNGADPCQGFYVGISSVTNETGTGLCNGSAIASVLNGGSTITAIQWSNGSIGYSASGLCGGTHMVEFTDALGCVASATAFISTNIDSVGVCAGVVINASITSTSATAGNCDATAEVTATGGTAPYMYQWSNGYQLSNLSYLCMGYYSVYVTDANGCMGGASAFIDGDTAILVPLDAVIITSDETVASACDGSAYVNVFGGVGPYSIMFSNGVSGNQVGSLCEGIYTATISDANGANMTSTFVIASPADIFVNNAAPGDSLADSVVVAVLTNTAVNDCVIDFTTIDSIMVTSDSIVDNSLFVVWTVYSNTNGNANFPQTYSVGPNGVYDVLLSIFCPNRASNGFVKAYDKVNVNKLASSIKATNSVVKSGVQPNPFNSYIQVSASADSKVLIYDVTGKEVYSGTVKTGNTLISTAGLTNGLYLVTISNQSEHKTLKLIKE